jgi:polysaccharide deacetylase family protein (PEP-CTERM system associated)
MICLSFDVEERFHSHLTGAGAEREWKAGDRIARIVDLLVDKRRAATFFIVAELAERYPALVRRIAQAGFEIGSHSYGHIRLDRTNRAACVEDLTRAKRVLEDIAGVPVVGFRAPTWTASRGDLWLWDLLIALGFRYDSSLFPFRTHMYGSNDNPVLPFWVRPELLEIPPSVWKRGPLRVPYGGGFYFRLYPAWLTERLMSGDRFRGRVPMIYLHPWEFDPDEAPIEAGWLNRFIGNVNVQGSWDKLREMLDRHETRTLLSLHDAIAGGSPPVPVTHA